MTPEEPTPAAPGLGDAVRARLREADAPLPLKEIAKGLTSTPGLKPAAAAAEVREHLEEEVREGRAHCYPSGKKAEPRYWARDERHLLRQKALEVASTPQPLPAIKKALAKAVKGTDAAYIEGLVGELAGEGLLFEHPPRTAKGGPQFATSPPPPPPLPLAELVREKVRQAPAPLTAKETVKGLPNPRKMKAPGFEAEVRKHLDEEVSLGQAFSAPSGKKGELRYWSKDEKHLLRERTLELCATPQVLSVIQKKIGKEGTGADGDFVESVVRELVAEDRLFEYPAKTKKAGPLFGSSPPPPEVPALEREQHRKTVDQLIKSCRGLMAKAAITAEELLGALRARLIPDDITPEAGAPGGEVPQLRLTEATLAQSATTVPESRSRVEELIFQAVSVTPVLSLADLRREMPPELQGKAFDEAVLRLAEEQKVLLSQDAEPTSFTEAERAGYVRDGLIWFTTIMQRG